MIPIWINLIVIHQKSFSSGVRFGYMNQHDLRSTSPLRIIRKACPESISEICSPRTFDFSYVLLLQLAESISGNKKSAIGGNES